MLVCTVPDSPVPACAPPPSSWEPARGPERGPGGPGQDIHTAQSMAHNGKNQSAGKEGAVAILGQQARCSRTAGWLGCPAERPPTLASLPGKAGVGGHLTVPDLWQSQSPRQESPAAGNQGPGRLDQQHSKPGRLPGAWAVDGDMAGWTQTRGGQHRPSSHVELV